MQKSRVKSTQWWRALSMVSLLLVAGFSGCDADPMPSPFPPDLRKLIISSGVPTTLMYFGLVYGAIVIVCAQVFINPPQGCILSVGAGEKRPWVKGGQLVVADVMTVTLTCDHRVVDGSVGAQWISVFKNLVENPIGLLI